MKCKHCEKQITQSEDSWIHEATGFSACSTTRAAPPVVDLVIKLTEGAGIRPHALTQGVWTIVEAIVGAVSDEVREMKITLRRDS